MNSQSSVRLDTLDLLRAVAAFAVVAGHARAFTFQSFPELRQAGADITLVTKFFYAATGLGHQAVIIFFALSGFLVGGKVLTDFFSNRFTWPLYLARRLTRLWIVLIPALAATLLFDTLGLTLTDGIGYDGVYSGLYLSVPGPNKPLDLSLAAFLGNLGFVQTIFVPTFGTNGPLWSLAYEFWYYIIFPLAAWLVLARTSRSARLVGALIFLGLLILIPMEIMLLGVIWVAGAGAAYVTRHARTGDWFSSWPVRIMALIALFAVLGASKTVRFNPGDLGLGIVVAAILPTLAYMPSPGGWYTSVARFGSEISYTLYLTHFPLITFITFIFFAPERFPPSWDAMKSYSLLIIASLAWSIILWWIFERNTDRLYATCVGRFILKRI